jgi:hypothetical protein
MKTLDKNISEQQQTQSVHLPPSTQPHMFTFATTPPPNPPPAPTPLTNLVGAVGSLPPMFMAPQLGATYNKL